MTLYDLKQFAAARQYQMVQLSVFGIYEKYPFQCVRATSRRCTVFLAVDGQPAGELLSALQGVLQGLQCKLRMPRRGMLSLSVPAEGPAAFDGCFSAAMDSLTGALAQAGVTPPRACPVCGKEGCESAGYIKGGFVPLHRACLEGEYRTGAQAEPHPGAYPMGILGAAGAALAGGLLNVAAALLFSQVYELLYLLIPLAACFGYLRLRGPKSRAAFTCVLLATLVGLIPIQLFRSYYLGGAGGGGLLPIVCLGVGLLIAWGMVSKPSARQERVSENILLTIQPLDPTSVRTNTRKPKK